MTPLPPDLEALMPEGHRARNFDELEIVFTADQVRAVMLAVTERAAKKCEDARDAAPFYRDEYDICNELAAAIRGNGSKT